MIFTFFISVIAISLNAMAFLLPIETNPYPQEIVDGWILISGMALDWNNIVPVVSMFNALVFYVTAWFFVFIWLFAKWVIGLIRGGS